MGKRVDTTIEQRTVSVSLDASPGQLDTLAEVVNLYNAAWGDVVLWCIANESVNKTTLQKSMYRPLREAYPQLPSQFISIVLRDGAAAVKSWNSNNPKNKWKLKARRKRTTLNYDLRIMSVRGNLIGFSTLRKTPRLRFLLNLPEWFENRYADKQLNAAKLVIRDGRVRANLIYRIPSVDVVSQGKVVGVDRGIKRLVYTSEGGEFSAAGVRAARRKFAYVRKTLQEKGTRSAKRRLKSLGDREARFVRNVNHVLTKQLAETPGVSTYVLEGLTGINKRKERARRKANKPMRTWLNGWSYFQLEQFLEYKCRQQGIAVVYVSPAYTSQRCNRCGFVDRRNRKGGRFDCRRCQHSDDADLNAARNIRDKHIYSAFDGGAGHLSTARTDGSTFGLTGPSPAPCGRGS